jgi:hypothetical protein
MNASKCSSISCTGALAALFARRARKYTRPVSLFTDRRQNLHVPATCRNRFLHQPESVKRHVRIAYASFTAALVESVLPNAP